MFYFLAWSLNRIEEMDKESIFDILPNRQITKRDLSKSETVPLGSIGKKEGAEAPFGCVSRPLWRGLVNPGSSRFFGAGLDPGPIVDAKTTAGWLSDADVFRVPIWTYVIRLEI